MTIETTERPTWMQAKTPKIARGPFREAVRRKLSWAKKYQQQAEQAAVECYERLIAGVEDGSFDFQPKPGAREQPERIDKHAVRQYLLKGLKFAQRYPNALASVSMQKLLDAIDAGQFTPLTKAEQQEALEARMRARNPEVALGDQDAMKVRETGAQRRTEAYAVTEQGYIDTDPVEEW